MAITFDATIDATSNYYVFSLKSCHTTIYE